MKLRTGQALYKIPEHSQILCVYIEGNQRHNQMWSYLLQLIDIGDLGLNKARGRPTYCAVFENKIEFSPVPNKPYKVRVRYVPPIKEY